MVVTDNELDLLMGHKPVAINVPCKQAVNLSESSLFPYID